MKYAPLASSVILQSIYTCRLKCTSYIPTFEVMVGCYTVTSVIPDHFRFHAIRDRIFGDFKIETTATTLLSSKNIFRALAYLRRNFWSISFGFGLSLGLRRAWKPENQEADHLLSQSLGVEPRTELES